MLFYQGARRAPTISPPPSNLLLGPVGDGGRTMCWTQALPHPLQQQVQASLMTNQLGKFLRVQTRPPLILVTAGNMPKKTALIQDLEQLQYLFRSARQKQGLAQSPSAKVSLAQLQLGIVTRRLRLAMIFRALKRSCFYGSGAPFCGCSCNNGQPVSINGATNTWISILHGTGNMIGDTALGLMKRPHHQL